MRRDETALSPVVSLILIIGITILLSSILMAKVKVNIPEKPYLASLGIEEVRINNSSTYYGFIIKLRHLNGEIIGTDMEFRLKSVNYGWTQIYKSKPGDPWFMPESSAPLSLGRVFLINTNTRAKTGAHTGVVYYNGKEGHGSTELPVG